MSLLIKGMAMPKNCMDCPLFESKYHFHGCHAVPKSFKDIDMWNFVGDRPSWCPLVELPPHGRLIDADALCDGLVSNHPVVIYAKSAPTIIEAEPCKEKGE